MVSIVCVSLLFIPSLYSTFSPTHHDIVLKFLQLQANKNPMNFKKEAHTYGWFKQEAYMYVWMV